MSDAVVLDATPLGILCHPRNPPQATACRQWVADLLAVGRRVIVPEIADYEVRRELIRASSQVALSNLDQLAQFLEYLPLATPAMRLAAALWARPVAPASRPPRISRWTRMRLLPLKPSTEGGRDCRNRKSRPPQALRCRGFVAKYHAMTSDVLRELAASSKDN